MNTRPSIAVCCIAKNEINNIERLTKSIEGCFDQYILVDTGSTDGTIERAKELGWQVEHFEWVQDFSAARNETLKYVKTDYWAWLDLDDSLPNKEAFIRWRDTCMVIADMWLAPYFYTTDAEGRPICNFLRERVIKTSLGAKWRYPIHEGLLPPQGAAVQMTQSWHIRHHRSLEDMKKDKGRNLGVFEKQLSRGEVLSSRELYYYGKELFEAQRPVEASEHLLKAASAPDTELHDRILAIQFGAMSLMMCSQWEKALLIAYQGLALAPNRAEFHCIISDCYLKIGKPQDAVPFLHSAQACFYPSGSSVIFNDAASYTVNPRNSLARVYAHEHNFDKAESVLAETAIKYPNNETAALLEEVRKLKFQTTLALKYAIPCDDIVITCPPNGAYKWDSKIYKERSMGGSETAAIEMSRWLTNLSGRKVIIFNPRDDEYIDDLGVQYKDISKIYEYMSKNKPYLHVAWRHTMRCTEAPTFIWGHDLFTPGAGNISDYNKHMCLTPFHKEWVKNMQGIPDEKIYVTRNGIVPERFLDTKDFKKDPNKFVFSSSPDRGLDRAMIVLDEVRKEFPDIKLHIFYGLSHLKNYGLSVLQEKLEKMIDERKDYVIYHGATKQDDLIAHFKTASYCVQPSDFVETSKITAIEMLCSGVYQITRGVGGCVDTLKRAEEAGMAKMVYSDCKTEEQYALYVEEVKKAMKEEKYRAITVNPYDYSWESVARQWLADLPKFAYN